MAITEGQFSEIGDFNIKVEVKYGNRGQYLTDVIVHQKKKYTWKLYSNKIRNR
jgi:lipopolysaccharide export system permease protein